MKNAVVVGGGVAGMFGALFLARRGLRVTLVEAAPGLGGLLKSVPAEGGLEFDCGAHFLRDTGVPDVDDELFTCLDDSWQRLPYLKIGTWSNGAFYDKSSFINARHLPDEIYARGIAELMDLPPFEGEAATCHEHLVVRFGETFTERLFREPVEKFMGRPLEELAPQAASFFDLVRIIAFTPEVARELKRSRWFDDRIAFHSFDEGQFGGNNYYPRSGGIGQWVPFVDARLREAGVDVRLDETLSELQLEGARVESATLRSGEKLAVDELIWTTPPPLLNKLAAVDPGFGARPELRSSVLIDLVFDTAFLTDVYYAVCLSAKFQPFRIFLYPNANAGPAQPGVHHTCVEVLSDGAHAEDVDPLQIAEDLKGIGLVAPGAKLLYQRRRVEAAGFPVFTPAFVENAARMREFVAQRYDNVTLVGKAAGRVFFMNATLVDTWKALKALLGDPVE